MSRVYFCPTCKRKIPYDKNYVLVVCSKCQEEMFEIEDNYKNKYKVEVKE